MAVSLTDKDPEHATAGSSEVSMQSNPPKGNEAEMKDSELDVQAAITLDPNSSESTNKGGETKRPQKALCLHNPYPQMKTPASTTAPATNAKVAKAFDQPRLPSAFKSQRPPEPKVAKSKHTYIDFKRCLRRSVLLYAHPNPASTSIPPTCALPAAPAGAPTPTSVPSPGSALALAPAPASVHTPAIASVNPAAPVLPSGPQGIVAPMAIDIPYPTTSTPTFRHPK
ncbi:hypothetical protein FA13DRAFT_1789338 [Coprinellus micaceus]|uniref:Uncharacterized protein n=1 Tax=Coprinellus micaceus TaxID=71717 RepID=A0A4Y7TJN1_COPMI|nr:hypothetical protein FA13DRAFT_1789338 [Coprinellus micaceus]